jgi:hypothetical protein
MIGFLIGMFSPLAIIICYVAYKAFRMSRMEHKVKSSLFSLFPALGDHWIRCPMISCKDTGSLWYIIIHLNDDHERDREQIARWLDAYAENHVIDLTIQPQSKGN